MDIYFINFFQIFVLKHLAGKRKQCPKLFWRYYVKLIYMKVLCKADLHAVSRG